MLLAAEFSLVLALLSTLLRHSGSLGANKVTLKKRCYFLIKVPGESPFQWESPAAILESCGGEVEGLGLRGVAAHEVSFLLGLCHRFKQKTKEEPTKKLEHEHKDSICGKMAQPPLSRVLAAQVWEFGLSSPDPVSELSIVILAYYPSAWA